MHIADVNALKAARWWGGLALIVGPPALYTSSARDAAATSISGTHGPTASLVDPIPVSVPGVDVGIVVIAVDRVVVAVSIQILGRCAALVELAVTVLVNRIAADFGFTWIDGNIGVVAVRTV
jgi:hypothetical protein